jgi:hypothetical protein
MAVTDIANSNLTFTGVPLGVQVTKVTDSSADWASVANSTYFYDKTDKLIHFKNSSGTVLEIFSTAGLTYFTEAQATTAPNATVYVDSLTAAGSTTNADVAIVPKGTGAFMLAVPDGTSTGGNKRGAGAVDLMSYRNAPGRVAIGTNAFAAGGDSVCSGTNAITIGHLCNATNTGSINIGSGTASGASAIAIGYSTTASGSSSNVFGQGSSATQQESMCLGHSSGATGSYSYCFGRENTSSGFVSTVLGGQNNTASGSRATAIGGQGNIASGNQSFAQGHSCTASGDYSFSMGFQANSFSIYGRQVYASGQEATSGDAQTSKFVLHERTTDTTATTLTTNSSAASTTNQVILSNQSAYRFKGTIIGKQSGSTNAAAWDVDGLIVRGANAAATTLTLGNVNLVSNTPAWGTPTLAADTTNGGLRVQVTGAAATNIQWTAIIETTEVIYA